MNKSSIRGIIREMDTRELLEFVKENINKEDKDNAMKLCQLCYMQLTGDDIFEVLKINND